MLFLSIMLMMLILGFYKAIRQKEKAIVDSPVSEEIEVVFKVVETMPEFPGGQQALMKFLTENLQYPANAKEKSIQGRVVCQFVVERNGTPSNIEVVSSSGEPSLDNEAVRVISIMPKWKPGKQRGKSVPVTFVLPIKFRLAEEPKEGVDVSK